LMKGYVSLTEDWTFIKKYKYSNTDYEYVWSNKKNPLWSIGIRTKSTCEKHRFDLCRLYGVKIDYDVNISCTQWYQKIR
jgi:hypothetical protein